RGGLRIQACGTDFMQLTEWQAAAQAAIHPRIVERQDGFRGPRRLPQQSSQMRWQGLGSAKPRAQGAAGPPRNYGGVSRTVGDVEFWAHGYVPYLFSACGQSQRLESAPSIRQPARSRNTRAGGTSPAPASARKAASPASGITRSSSYSVFPPARC